MDFRPMIRFGSCIAIGLACSVVFMLLGCFVLLRQDNPAQGCRVPGYAAILLGAMISGILSCRRGAFSPTLNCLISGGCYAALIFLTALCVPGSSDALTALLLLCGTVAISFVGLLPSIVFSNRRHTSAARKRFLRQRH